jgi:NAD(P)-dependent dehydrogenase (short-subunit alcohol dehydrogenase family)
MLLEGQVAMVTGTGPNLGSEIARTLSTNGAKVACLDARADQAEKVADEIRQKGGEALAVVADVTKPEDVQRAVEKTTHQFGALHILVNSAAISPRTALFDFKLEDWRKTLDIILTGVVLCTRYAAEKMVEQKQGGSIINIRSTSGYRGRTDVLAYSTAKGGLMNLTRSLALTLAPHKIRVNCVTPSSVGIPLASDGQGRPRKESGAPNHIPLGRWSEVEDPAQAVLFLASPNSSFITGIDIPVDGGTLAKGGGAG